MGTFLSLPLRKPLTEELGRDPTAHKGVVGLQMMDEEVLRRHQET